MHPDHFVYPTSMLFQLLIHSINQLVSCEFIISLAGGNFEIRDSFTECVLCMYNMHYRIRPYYRTYPYKCTVKKFRSLQITTSVVFSLLLYKGICCGYSSELHRQVNAIQMSTHNICLCKESQKKLHSHH